MNAQELKAKAESRLASTLRKVLLGEDAFPLVIGYERLKADAAPSEFIRLKEFLRSQSKEVLGYGPTILMEERNTRRYGKGLVPGAIRFESMDDLARYVGKKAWVDRVQANSAALCAVLPDARNWAAAHLDRLSEGDAYRWNDIGTVVKYMGAHPFPGVYARQVPVPVHTKFIEENRSEVVLLLAELYPSAVDATQPDWRRKIGIRDIPDLIEGRFLDPNLAPHLPFHFLAPIEDWQRCHLGAARFVVVTENRTNFLTLPPTPSTLAFLGMGYAAQRLAGLSAFRTATVYYWGDMDIQGYAILARLRSVVPSVKSLLMDRVAFDAHPKTAGDPTLQHSPDEIRAFLFPDEANVFEECLREQTRCEQERIPQSTVEGVFSRHFRL